MTRVFAATGHRPEKLGGHGVHTDTRLRKLAAWFFEFQRPDTAISGMALGWDLAYAEAAIALGIPVIAAVPFEGQEWPWPEYAQDRYRFILERCERVETVCRGGYAPWKMQKRNEWMVDNATHVVALWDGTSGGTRNCVRYAEGKVPICNIWSSWQSGAF